MIWHMWVWKLPMVGWSCPIFIAGFDQQQLAKRDAMGIWTPNIDDFSPKKGRRFGMATINHPWTGAYTCLHMLTPWWALRFMCSTSPQMQSGCNISRAKKSWSVMIFPIEMAINWRRIFPACQPWASDFLVLAHRKDRFPTPSVGSIEASAPRETSRKYQFWRVC